MEPIVRQATSKGPAEWFTGDVYVDAIARGLDPSRVQISIVHFSPGARSAWHSHGTGQTLYVTDGIGLVQSRGERIHQLRAGAAIQAVAGEEHWHGAAPDHFMTHISITENDPDRPSHWGVHVTDEEYNGPLTS